GRAAAQEIAKEYQTVRDEQLSAYINRIGKKLAAHPLAESESYPYSFTLVYDTSVNAFALPGGPTFVHTGLIQEADNEAQLAGVMAHEIAHVALRHGTHQATKALGLQLIAGFAGASVGGKGLLGQLAQAGIAFGANSVLLKYSRDAEKQADLLGAQIMAGAGYNPIEMARFFEKLEAQGGSRGPQFFSSHPNPGNRTKAIEEIIPYLPRASYTGDSGQFRTMKQRVAALKGYSEPRRGAASQPAADPASARPSGQYRQYQGRGFTLLYPDNWQAMGNQTADSVTLAAPAGVLQSQSGSAIGYGAIAVYVRDNARTALDARTRQLISELQRTNPSMRVVGTSRTARVGGQQALITTLNSESPYPGQTEVDTLVTVQRPDGMFYLILIAPQSETSRANTAFNRMLNSVRFGS
ncbi:MAG TPA: M48 family metalloprotease, partial [Bryobacteraceae bacterium]|nr:M48 family metalloprotease [Bryobacteraceae bacterium]